MKHSIESDYLVVGAGAMGMAFADEIIFGSKAATVTIVDRRAKAGGHWNDAYPFVTLHQPALYYGVNSEPLGSGGGDLVSRAQILAYYEKVIDKLTRTGRFRLLPLCEYRGGSRGQSRVASALDPELEYAIDARKKVVDATYMDVKVPATTKPKFHAANGIPLVPINGLTEVKESWERYVIIGAGKTGIDAVLYLLDREVDPDRITWIVSNDAWFFNRRALMPKTLADDMPSQLRCIAESNDLREILLNLEAQDRLLRLDPEVWPRKYRCATVIDEELAALRRIENVVRKGRVVRIDEHEIRMTEGSLTSEPRSLYVDCTADGLAKRPARPIFDGDRLTLQSISMCQQVFSAAAIAAIEVRYDDDEKKNAMCQPVPHPEFPADFLAAISTTFSNLETLGGRLALWSVRKRLSLGAHMSWLGLIRFAIRANRWRIDDPQRIEALRQAYLRAERPPESLPEASPGVS